MTPIFFEKQSDFRKWLKKNHTTETELLVGFYKISSGKPSMTWSESVDEALCFGWIDGIRKSFGDDTYCIRFTPRKANSTWSAVNIKKIEALTQQSLMHPAGLDIYNKRKEDKSKIYSDENKPERLADELEKEFITHKTAWEFFKMQAPSYQKTAYYWVMSAKQEATKLSRLGKLINSSEAGKKLF